MVGGHVLDSSVGLIFQCDRNSETQTAEKSTNSGSDYQQAQNEGDFFDGWTRESNAKAKQDRYR